jgi:L-threonylcarbamoyladenylate synthase
VAEIFACGDPVQRERGLARAVAALREGRLAVVPTDTVYGIAADAFRPAAVAGLLAAKGRGRDMPVPVLVSSLRMLDGVASGLPPAARSLVEAFWPGALTVIVRHSPQLAWDLGDARGTVAVRMPLHPLTLELIAQTGPLAVSSANRTGQPPALTAGQAVDQLGDAVTVYLDADRVDGGVPSTIVDLTATPPRVVRAGPIPLVRLQSVLPELVPAEPAPAAPAPAPADDPAGGPGPAGLLGAAAQPDSPAGPHPAGDPGDRPGE